MNYMLSVFTGVYTVGEVWIPSALLNIIESKNENLQCVCVRVCVGAYVIFS